MGHSANKHDEKNKKIGYFLTGLFSFLVMVTILTVIISKFSNNGGEVKGINTTVSSSSSSSSSSSLTSNIQLVI
jgi:uncharacterized membrane protein